MHRSTRVRALRAVGLATMVAVGFVVMPAAQAAISGVTVTARCRTGAETTNFVVIKNDRATAIAGTITGHPGSVAGGPFTVPANTTQAKPVPISFQVAQVTVNGESDFALLSTCGPATSTTSSSTSTSTSTSTTTSTTVPPIAGLEATVLCSEQNNGGHGILKLLNTTNATISGDLRGKRQNGSAETNGPQTFSVPAHQEVTYALPATLNKGTIQAVSGANATPPKAVPCGPPDVTTTTGAPTTSSSTTTTTTTTVPPVGPKQARPLVERNGTWYLRNSHTSGVADASFTYGNGGGDIPITGDWDGNGSVTPGVVRNGTWYLRNSNTSGVADVSFLYGNGAGDIPIVGDWDGNGTFTPGVVRNGTWYLRNSNTQGVADTSFLYGNGGGDIPVPGDWDSSKTTTPGIVRNGIWHIRNSNTQGIADSSFAYGNAGDKPLAADWDGNDSVTPGVVRGSTWYIRNSNTQGVADFSFNYGNSDDRPLTWRP